MRYHRAVTPQPNDGQWPAYTISWQKREGIVCGWMLPTRVRQVASLAAKPRSPLNTNHNRNPKSHSQSNTSISWRCELDAVSIEAAVSVRTSTLQVASTQLPRNSDLGSCDLLSLDWLERSAFRNWLAQISIRLIGIQNVLNRIRSLAGLVWKGQKISRKVQGNKKESCLKPPLRSEDWV